MSLLRDLVRPARREAARGDVGNLDLLDALADGMGLGGLVQTMAGNREEVPQGFEGFVQYVYRQNGIVAAAMAARFKVFSEARFQWQAMRHGVAGEFTDGTDMRQPLNRGLQMLAHPEPSKTTGDLLTRVMLDNDTAGNAFIARRPGGLKTMRPDWTGILIGSAKPAIDGTYEDLLGWDLDAEVVGYHYAPMGPHAGHPLVLLREDVAHFSLTPDPTARYRGMSWVTPILREVMADNAATGAKLAFFEHGMTPNMLVKLPVADPAKFREWQEVFEQSHAGARNFFKTMYLGQGHDAVALGSNLRDVDFKNVQGGGETRIALASGVPAVILQIAEGLAGSSLNQGNFGAARRQLADMTLRPAWRNLCDTLAASITPPPDGYRLWYDDSDIPFLAEDVKDAAEVLAIQAAAIKALIDTGFKSDAAVSAVTSGDLSRLDGQHTGLFSVQLQAPGSAKMPSGEAPGETPVGGGAGPEAPAPADAAPAQEPAASPGRSQGPTGYELASLALLARATEPLRVAIDTDAFSDVVADLRTSMRDVMDVQSADRMALTEALEIVGAPVEKDVLRDRDGRITHITETRRGVTREVTPPAQEVAADG